MQDILKKRIASFGYAFKGVYILFKTQIHAQFHLLSTIIVIFTGLYFNINIQEWCFISIAITMVIAAEGFNTAIEFLTDLTSPDYHPLAGKSKDVAAGAVLITAIGAAIIGGLIFLPKIIEMVS